MKAASLILTLLAASCAVYCAARYIGGQGSPKLSQLRDAGPAKAEEAELVEVRSAAAGDGRASLKPQEAAPMSGAQATADAPPADLVTVRGRVDFPPDLPLGEPCTILIVEVSDELTFGPGETPVLAPNGAQLRVTTDREGHFEVALPRELERVGFELKAEHLYARRGFLHRVEEASDELVISAQLGAALTLRLNPKGAAAAERDAWIGRSLRFAPRSEGGWVSNFATLDENLEARFFALPPGPFRIEELAARPSLDSFGAKSLEETFDPFLLPPAESYVLRRGEEHLIPLLMQRGIGLEGRVVDEEGDPVSGVRAALTSTERSRGELRFTTRRGRASRAGTFQLTVDPALELELEIRGEGHETRWLSDSEIRSTLLAEAGSRTITLPRHQRVEGRVVLFDGSPVPGAAVTLGSIRSGSSASAKADEQGRFSIALTAKGPARLSAEARILRASTDAPQAWRIGTGWPKKYGKGKGGQMVSTSVPIEGPASDLELVLLRGPEIPVEVVDELGKAVERATIHALRIIPERTAPGRLADYARGHHPILIPERPDGTQLLTNLPQGHFVVWATARKKSADRRRAERRSDPVLIDAEALPASVELVVPTSASEGVGASAAPKQEPSPPLQLIAIESPSGEPLSSSARIGLASSDWGVVRWLEYLPSEGAFAVDGRYGPTNNFTVKWSSGTINSFTVARAGGDSARITLTGGAAGPAAVQGRLRSGERALRGRSMTLRYPNGVSVSSVTDDRGRFILPAICIGDAEIYASGVLGTTPVTVPKGGVSGLDFDLPTGEVTASFPAAESPRQWVRLLVPEEALAALEEQSLRDERAIDEAQFRAVAVGAGRSIGSRQIFEYVPAGRYQVIMIPHSRARTRRNLPSIEARSAPFSALEGASITAPPCQE